MKVNTIDRKNKNFQNIKYVENLTQNIGISCIEGIFQHRLRHQPFSGSFVGITRNFVELILLESKRMKTWRIIM